MEVSASLVFLFLVIEPLSYISVSTIPDEIDPVGNTAFLLEDAYDI